MKILDTASIKVEYLVDKNERLQKSGLGTYSVISPEEFLKKKEKVIVILAGKYWRDMLRFLNEHVFSNAEVLYMRNVFF